MTRVPPGVLQPVPPRALQVQQHMPFIELRHRAPENRLRLPFPPPTCPDPQVQVLRPRDPAAAVTPGSARPGESMLVQQHLGHDGMEEHLEGEESAVKDLEDVEVKDLVDLNLNLDPEDGRSWTESMLFVFSPGGLTAVLVLTQVKKTWTWVPMTSTWMTSCCRGSLTSSPTLTQNSTWRTRRTCSTRTWTWESLSRTRTGAAPVGRQKATPTR